LGVIVVAPVALKFPTAWRALPPENGVYINRSIPPEAIEELLGNIRKLSLQGHRWDVLEHFKSYMASATGSPNCHSSSESWAESDLQYNMDTAGENAPVFIEAFFEGCESLKRKNPDWWTPDSDAINSILRRHNIGYQIQGAQLVSLDSSQPAVPVPPAPPTLEQTALELYQTSVKRSEDLLLQGHPREAVQESLWLLETVSTAFRGVETESGSVAGRYFNQIVRDLRRLHPGTTLERTLEWITALHGYLSSPGGGGVRHGLDLTSGTPLSQNDGHLYCNLIRSYLGYLLAEHAKFQDGRGGK
jgi:hypothetical protein